MPKWRSKKQQRFAFGVLVKRGKMSKAAAKKRSSRGRAYKRLPSRARRRKKK